MKGRLTHSTVLRSINVIVKIKNVEYIYEIKNCLFKYPTLKNTSYICSLISLKF